MMIKRNFYSLFLLLFCLNSVALAQSDVTQEQVEAWVKVSSARGDYQDAKDDLLQLKIDKNTAELDLAQKKYAQGDNREQYIEAIASREIHPTYRKILL